MNFLTTTIPNNCEILIHGDTHEGSRHVAEDALDALLDYVMGKPNRFLIHMGDALEAITTDDKRYHDESNSEPIPIRQAIKVAERYNRARERILCWLWGNHDCKLERYGNLIRDVVLYRLGRQDAYGGYTCKLKLVTSGKNPKQVCKMFLAHGYRRALNSNAKDFEQQQANMKAALKRLLVHKAGDCLVMGIGDTHKLLLVPPAERLILSDDGSKIVTTYLRGGDGADSYIEPDRRWYFNSGSFMRLYVTGIDGYAERAGYDPTELGYIKMVIKEGCVKELERVVV